MLIALLKLIIFKICSVFLLLFGLIFLLLQFLFPLFPLRFFCYCVVKLHMLFFNIDIRIKGAKLVDKGVLFVSNHVSYLDSFLLLHCVPGVFLVKDGIMGSFLRSAFAKVGFVFTPQKVVSVYDDIDAVRKSQAKGNNVFFYPEGQTTEGHCVFPFISSMFQVVKCDNDNSKNNRLQAISLCYASWGAFSFNFQRRVKFSWNSSRSILKYLFMLLRSKRKIRVIMYVHEPVDVSRAKDRKEIALITENQVKNGLSFVRKHYYV